MNDNPFETEIRYRLAQVTSEKTKEGADAYRAVTSHDPVDMVDLAIARFRLDKTLGKIWGQTLEENVWELWGQTP